MPQVQWKKYFARKFSASRFEIVMRVFHSDFYQKEFSVRLENGLVVPDQGNHAIYYEPDEWTPFAKKVYDRVTRDYSTFQKYRALIREAQEDFVRSSQVLIRGDLSKLSTKEFLVRYQTFARKHQEFFNIAIWIPFITEPFISEAANEVLARVLSATGQMDKYNEYFEVVFSPDEKNAIVREYLDFLQLVLDIRDGEAHVKWYLEEHVKKYGWIPCYDIYDRPWDEAYFLERVRQTGPTDEQVINEMEKVDERFRERPGKFREIISRTELTRQDVEKLRMAHEMAFIKDERDDYRRRGGFTIQPLFMDIGRRAGLSLREILHLLDREMIAFLEKGVLPPLEKIRERVQGYVLLRKGSSKVDIFSGQEAARVIEEELGHEKIGAAFKTRGTVGSKGSTEGEVYRVITKHDLRRMPDGAIMVTVTTHPDFVPSMRRCRAIVTNEGGITCHAAIVSRELRIPCVVGTTNATDIFETGDRVFVDGEKGIVTKIL